MKKHLALILLVFAIPVIIAALTACDDGCNFSKGTSNSSSFVKLIGGAYSQVFRGDSTRGDSIWVNAGDTILASQLSRVSFYYETQIVSLHKSDFGTGGTLLACSPLPPKPTDYLQKIKQVTIISKYQYGANVKPNDTINQLFKDYRCEPYVFGVKYYAIDSLIGRPATREFNFRLLNKQAVTTITPFQLEAVLQLSDSSVIYMTSPMVYLKP